MGAEPAAAVVSRRPDRVLRLLIKVIWFLYGLAMFAYPLRYPAALQRLDLYLLALLVNPLLWVGLFLAGWEADRETRVICPSCGQVRLAKRSCKHCSDAPVEFAKGGTRAFTLAFLSWMCGAIASLFAAAVSYQ